MAGWTDPNGQRVHICTPDVTAPGCKRRGFYHWFRREDHTSKTRHAVIGNMSTVFGVATGKKQTRVYHHLVLVVQAEV